MEKKYYSIKEVSEMLNVPASTLRFWEQEIPKLKPNVTAGGTRRYSAKDIDLLRMIIYLINEKHFTLEGVRDNLANDTKLERGQIIARVSEKLMSIRKELQEIRKELNEHEALSDELIIDDVNNKQQ